MKYEKIVIKKKSDLPKVKGEYICGVDCGFVPVAPIDYPGDIEGWWMKHVKWYLIPIKENNLREELIKYLEWEQNENTDRKMAVYGEPDEIVDNYIKNKP
jgi:hypothetical protein